MIHVVARCLVVQCLLASLCVAIWPSRVAAQFRVSETRLSNFASQLKQDRAKLSKKVAALNYEDPGPGDEQGWRVSQTAWEKMESPLGFPSENIRRLLAIDPGELSQWQKDLKRNFYLGLVNEETKLELQPLTEHVQWIQTHKRSGQGGISDETLRTMASKLWKRRIVDTYRSTTKDTTETQKVVIPFLDNAAANFSYRGWLDNLSGRLLDKCLKSGSKDPIFLSVSYHSQIPKHEKFRAAGLHHLPKVIVQLDSPQYPRLLKMLAGAAQSRIHREKNNADGGEIDKVEADELAAGFNKSIIEMLVAESRCPENIELLKPALWMAGSNFREDRHRVDLYEALLESDLHEGFKQATLQYFSYSLAVASHLKFKVSRVYLAQARTHGESAAELLPLSALVCQQLVECTANLKDPEACADWYEKGVQRAPGRSVLHESYLKAVGVADDDAPAKFMHQLLTSDPSTSVPWLGVALFDRYLRRSESGDIRKSKKVLDAFEELLKKGPEHGKSPEWCKLEKQYLNHLMLEAGFYEDSLRIAKELKGNFGKYDYEGQKITVARIAQLANTFARQTQESIDKGTLDVTKIGETIDNLAQTRMDMGSVEGNYIDELLELLKSIETFESGQWADLTEETVYLTNWKGSQLSENWMAFQNVVQTSSSTDSIAWRWPIKGAYMVEADIDIMPHQKNFSKHSGAAAGLAISNGRNDRVVVGPWMGALVNPYKEAAEIRGHRDKIFNVKGSLNQQGLNRVRLRVWKDYFEFTINGKIAGQYAIQSPLGGHVLLQKAYGRATAKFKHVRVRKLIIPSPTFERRDDVRYWTKRLQLEPECEDVQLGLAGAKRLAEAKEASDEAKKNQQAVEQPKRNPLAVKDGLVAMWTFDNELSESVSQRKTTSALPAKFVPGKLGGGLQLSEANSSYTIIADGEGPINLNGPYTISFWARWQSKNGILLSQVSSKKSMGLSVDISDRKLRVDHRNGALIVSTFVERLPLKTWQHITITHDGSNNAKGLKVFVQGKNRAEISHYSSASRGVDLPAIDSSQTQLRFGAEPFDSTFSFGIHGIMDEVRVYDRDLSAKEVEQVHSYGLR